MAKRLAMAIDGLPDTEGPSLKENKRESNFKTKEETEEKRGRFTLRRRLCSPMVPPVASSAQRHGGSSARRPQQAAHATNSAVASRAHGEGGRGGGSLAGSSHGEQRPVGVKVVASLWVGEDLEPELPGLELQHAPDPAVAVQLQSGDVGPVKIQIEVAGVQGRAPAAATQQAVDKGAEGVDAAGQASGAGEADGGRGPPVVAPALGENARAHRILRRQQREDVVKDPLREVTDSISPSRHGRRSGLGHALRRTGGVRR
ncbi:unnamed protein product [Miscanthus lutarioriparius]|uniref:Uncharacterized protein n=1 Tax=Miscanthus lutarioriparius TaxID=422564 RepID=A0A811PEZ1_9POAL|nr:unnamed protein product [Miscanthus lutarioriparius]